MDARPEPTGCVHLADQPGPAGGWRPDDHARPLRILTYTSLYPSTRQPVHGMFVQELVAALSRSAHVEVLAPENGLRQLLPAPGRAPRIALRDEAVLRCHFFTVPRLLKRLDYRLMEYFCRAAFQQAMQARPELVHAHYAYPDAAAASLLARRAGLPLVVTCHGSDINVLAKDPSRARLMAQTLGRASAVVAVSRDLAGKIAALGVDPGRIHHIPNGVDATRFPLADKGKARHALGLEPGVPLLVAAGRLEPVKGYDRLLRAVALLDDAHLVLVGDGSLRASLERLAGKLGIGHRVRFAGMVSHGNLAPYFQAADLLVISSHSEGWPTVIHEALACGTPVVAPALGGIPEALADPALGLVVPTGEPGELARGIRRALDATWDRAALRRAALAHDWNAVAADHLELYRRVLGRNH